jgi:hypothetical protein
MDDVTFVDFTNRVGEVVTNAIITHIDGSQTSMLKSTYDTLVSNSSTPQAGN